MIRVLFRLVLTIWIEIEAPGITCFQVQHQVKIFFVGFHGEGNAGLLLDSAELDQWARAIDTLLLVTHDDKIARDAQAPQVTQIEW